MFLSAVSISSILIASAGAIISIIGALYLSKKKIDADFRIRRIDLTSIYAENLLKVRLEHYPQQWYYLSDYLKVLRNQSVRGGVTQVADIEGLYEFYEKVNEWNSKHSIIFSNHSSVLSANLRRVILDILKNYKGEDQIGQLTAPEKTKIINAMHSFEIGLRIDIGIQEVDEFEDRKLAMKYSEIEHKNITELRARLRSSSA